MFWPPRERRASPVKLTARWGLELREPLAGQLCEPLERAIKRLKPTIDFIEPARPEIDRPAIMARQEQGAERVRLVRLQQVAHQHDRSRVGLGDLPALLGQEAVVQPVRGERFAGIRLRLDQFVLMVGKDQVEAAAVDIEVAAQVFHAHRRAFDVPARSPAPPGALPRRLAGLRALPEREIARMMLERRRFDPGTSQKRFRVAVAQLAILAGSNTYERPRSYVLLQIAERDLA